MTQNSKYSLIITSAGYEVITSGLIHITSNEVKFKLAGLEIKYKFITDSGESRYDISLIESKLLINLYNFTNSLGEGMIEPIEIGTLSNRKLFATFYVNTINNSIRQFNYSFLLKEV